MFLQWVKSQIYDLLAWFVKLSNTSINKNTLLLVRTSNMGDYILWRNMLKYIRESDRFKDYHITLIGNKVWKNLLENLDAKYIDEVIWVDMMQFKSDMSYRYSILKQTREKGYEVVVNTIYSRCKRMDDAFVIVCPAKAYKIGYKADMTNVFLYEVGYDRKLYQELFVTNELFEFDFIRTIRFTEFLLKINIPHDLKPEMVTKSSLPAELVGKRYFVVFPGSSSPKRIWKAENFASAIKYVVAKYDWVPVLAGSQSDEPYIMNVLSLYDGQVINMCGKTSLVEFATILKEAKLLVSIDTGAVHLAAVVGCTIFALYNGSHYGRYDPYPANINPNIYGIYPDEVEKEIFSGAIPAKYSMPQYYDYNDISPEKVCKAISKHFAGR